MKNGGMVIQGVYLWVRCFNVCLCVRVYKLILCQKAQDPRMLQCSHLLAGVPDVCYSSHDILRRLISQGVSWRLVCCMHVGTVTDFCSILNLLYMFVVFDSLPCARSISCNFVSGHFASRQKQTRTWHAYVAIGRGAVIKLVKENVQSWLQMQSDPVDVD